MDGMVGWDRFEQKNTVFWRRSSFGNRDSLLRISMIAIKLDHAEKREIICDAVKAKVRFNVK